MNPNRIFVVLLAGLMLCASVSAEAGKRRPRRTTNKRVVKKTPKKAKTKQAAKPAPQKPAVANEPAANAAVAAGTPGEETEVQGDDEIVADTEEEVSFDGEEEVSFDDEDGGTLVGEDVKRGELDDGFFMPEYADNSWMVALPMLCVLLLAWNVRWSAGGSGRKIKTWPDGDHTRRRPKTGAGGNKRRTTRG